MRDNYNPVETPVTHNTSAKRFEIVQGDALAVLDYELEVGKIILSHTGVPQVLEGQGIGSRLARAGLDYAREHGLKVVALCSFVAAYIEKHPQYQDLVE